MQNQRVIGEGLGLLRLTWTPQAGERVNVVRTHNAIEKAYAKGQITRREREELKRQVRHFVRQREHLLSKQRKQKSLSGPVPCQQSAGLLRKFQSDTEVCHVRR